MKTKTLFYMALTAVMTTLAACSQDDEPLDAAPKLAQIEFEITDGGYGGDEATRVKEEGFCTKFTANDECGLYIIDNNGNFIAKNVKLTAEEVVNKDIIWKVAEGDISGATENSKYFLYYPYVSNADNWVSSTSDNGDIHFFNQLISNWSVKSDQSFYENYTRSDLMTATGDVNNMDGKLKVFFHMTHRMALAIIKVPETIVYKFTNEGITNSEYTVPTSVEFNDGDNYLQPLPMEDGTYRCIVNPKEEEKRNRSIAGTINGSMKFNMHDLFEKLTKEKYKIVRIGGADAADGIKKEHNLQVGDYLLKDGRLVGKDNLNSDQKGNVVAIVFAVGHNQYDKSDYSETGIGSEKCHGYAVALYDAPESYEWGQQADRLGCCPEGVDSEDKRVNDWNGYGWTQKIQTAAANNPSCNYAAALRAVNYNPAYITNTVAPTNSSGWFLPSIGQMKEIWTQSQESQANLFKNKVGRALGANGYWASSEEYSDTQQALFVKSDGNVEKASKESSNRVRSILAF